MTEITKLPPGARTVQLKTFADFKRFLKEPGATVELKQHDGLWNIDPQDEAAMQKRIAMWLPRKVKKLQTNGVQFENGSWLYWKKASGYRCEGNRVTVDINDDGHFKKVMVYECSLPAL